MRNTMADYTETSRLVDEIFQRLRKDLDSRVAKEEFLESPAVHQIVGAYVEGGGSEPRVYAKKFVPRLWVFSVAA